MCKTHTDTNGPSAGRSRRSRLARFATIAGGVLLAAMLMAGWGKIGHAAVPQDDPFAGLDVMNAGELAEKRGGFFDAVLGISLNLGANVLTTMNNQLVLTTNVTIDAGGTHVTNIPAATNLTGLTFLDSTGAAIAGIESQNFPGPVTITANGTSVTVPAGFQGLVAKSDSGGLVAAVNKITKEQFANLVINANAVDPSGADPLSIVKQELNIDIDVQGFAALQQNIQLNSALTKFRDAMRAASLGALGIN